MGGGVENVEDKLVSYIEKLRTKGTDQNAYLKQIFSSVRLGTTILRGPAPRHTSPSTDRDELTAAAAAAAAATPCCRWT